MVSKFVSYIVENDLGSKELDVILAGHHDLIHVPTKVHETIQSSIVPNLADVAFVPRIAG